MTGAFPRMWDRAADRRRRCPRHRGCARYGRSGAGDTISGGIGADILKGDSGDDIFVDTNFSGDIIDGGIHTVDNSELKVQVIYILEKAILLIIVI